MNTIHSTESTTKQKYCLLCFSFEKKNERKHSMLKINRKNIEKTETIHLKRYFKKCDWREESMKIWVWLLFKFDYSQAQSKNSFHGGNSLERWIKSIFGSVSPKQFGLFERQPWIKFSSQCIICTDSRNVFITILVR